MSRKDGPGAPVCLLLGRWYQDSVSKGIWLESCGFFSSAVSAIHKELLCLLVPTNPRGWFPDLSTGSSLSDVFVPWLSGLGQHSRDLTVQVLVTATFHSAGQARHVK